jgi:hypothetical protein
MFFSQRCKPFSINPYRCPATVGLGRAFACAIWYISVSEVGLKSFTHFDSIMFGWILKPDLTFSIVLMHAVGDCVITEE